ncbi:MAG: NrtA/SsuA/CpmA family ABC transporter substrate-binding protein [Syntrophobacteraceae bacterium]
METKEGQVRLFCGTQPVAAVLWIFILLAIPSPLRAEEVRLGTWKTAQTIQPFFYGQFLPPSWKATVSSFTNPGDQKAALLACSLDMTGTTVALAIQAASRGEPVVMVAALCNKCSALVVKKDGPVQSPADLRGKRIGYVPGTMHEILLREVLARAGLSADKDVQLVRVDFFDMGTALAGGAIDAFLSGEPFPAVAQLQGYGRILSYPYFDDAIGAINAGMIVMRETVAKRPDLVGELVRAHARATEHLTGRPDEWVRKASEFGIPVDVLRESAGNIELAWKMDTSFVQKAKNLGIRMQELGMIERQPDYGKLFDLSFVEAFQAAPQEAVP